MKADCYDAANLIGCAGMKYPEGLVTSMVIHFLETLRSESDRKRAGMDCGGCRIKHGPWFRMALWWLRKKDAERLETEGVYMGATVRKVADLLDIWIYKKVIFFPCFLSLCFVIFTEIFR